ncbi:MAG TPA: two-component regulator propeller domain-containing protein [Thermoanaerobaculia bacterium]|nr:two-component regulator propeller domain-containing protein [Thermoanaerobaculia bacterium]
MRAARRYGLALLALALAAGSPAAFGAVSRIWVCDSASDFSSGEARGVSVAMDGTLVLSRDSRRVDGITEATIFTAVRDKDGNVLIGTGSEGKLLRVTPAGRVETAATLTEKEVTAVAVAPDGTVYVGASPGGKVYRIEKGKPVLHYDTKAQYVWALAFSGKALYVATGIPGEIHRILGDKGERLHATNDAHVRTLYADSKGRVWAGTSGSGLVLRVDPSGLVTTVYDSSKLEITSISGGADGRVWVAASSAEAPNSSQEPISAPQPLPTTRPSRQANSREGEEAQEKPEVTVTVGQPRLAPPKPGGRQGGYSSEVLLFEEGEPPRTVWTSPDEIVFDLAPDGQSPAVLAATGPHGKLYRLGTSLWALERTFDEKQVTALAGGAVATNAASAIYRLTDGPRQGEYVSAVKDTGRTSRFGAFRVEADIPQGSKLEFAFRSGESGLPDSTWSPWSPYVAAAPQIADPAPPGRYLQWRARMSADGAKVPVVRRVEAAYKNRNAAPVVESFVALGPSEVLARSASGGSNVFETTAPDEKGIFTSLDETKSEPPPRRLLRKGYRTLTWKATDADGDTLTYELEFKPAGASRWYQLKKGLRESFYSFDTTALPDGEYVFRVTAADSESNPEEPKHTSRETSLVTIDNTPPAVRKIASSSDTFEFEARDSASPIYEAEYSVDAREWTRIEPKDGISDSPVESYVIKLDPKWKGSFLLIRVTDAARNTATASFTLP